MASLARFFELTPPVLRLPAAFAVPAHSPLEILFGLVDSSLAPFVAVVGVCARHAAKQQQRVHRSSKQSDLPEIPEHWASSSAKIIVPLGPRFLLRFAPMRRLIPLLLFSALALAAADPAGKYSGTWSGTSADGTIKIALAHAEEG